MLRLNARPESFDNAIQKDFFKGAFPRFAQEAIEVLGLLLIAGLMPVAKELIRGLPFILQESDFLLDGHRDPGQLLRADTRTLRQLAHVLIKLRNPLLFGELFEEEEENNVVCENNDLPGLGFLHQPPCNTVAPSVVEGRDRIVKHDAGGIIGSAEFRKECRYGETALLAFAHHPRQFNTGRTGKDEFVIENTLGSAGFLKFDLDVAEGEVE